MSSIYTLYMLYAGYSVYSKVHHVYEYYCFVKESISFTKKICNGISSCKREQISQSKDLWILVDYEYDDSIDIVVPFEEEAVVDSNYFK